MPDLSDVDVASLLGGVLVTAERAGFFGVTDVVRLAVLAAAVDSTFSAAVAAAFGLSASAEFTGSAAAAAAATAAGEGGLAGTSSGCRGSRRDA